MVIGSRYIKGAATHDQITSIIMSRILNYVYRFVLGIKAKDISTNYRLYDTDQPQKACQGIETQNYDLQEEILLLLRLNDPDLRIGEVPISFEKRMYGESKRNLLPFIIGYIESLFRLTSLRIKKEIMPKSKDICKPFLIIGGILAIVLCAFKFLKK